MTTLQDALVHGTGRERQFHCHVHGDTNPSASVNVEKGVWVCYACGAKGRVGETELPETSLLDAIEEIFSDPGIRIYPESWLNQFNGGLPHQYWMSRFTVESIIRFRLGYDASNRMPCYPLRDVVGHVLGVVYRSLDVGHTGWKYRYPPGVKISTLLFNASLDHHDVVVLTEGAMDAVAVCETGWHGLACYGSRLTSPQIGILNKINPKIVALAFDNDEAGDRATHQAADDLELRGFLVHKIDLPHQWKDVAEMPLKIRQEIMDDSLASFARRL